MRLYKSDISYFSGKVEAYLHVKKIEHEALDSSFFECIGSRAARVS